MPVDPSIPQAGTAEGRLYERVAALERQLADLQTHSQGEVPVVAALPTAGRVGRVRILASDGHLYRDIGTGWVDVG